MNKVPWWVWGIGVAGVGYVLYRLVNKVPQALNTATSAVAQGIANIWLSLPPAFGGMDSAITVAGNVKLPDGTLVPVNNLIRQIRQDYNTPPNVYANVNGTIYQLSPSDPQGNYPAALLGPAPAGA